MSQASRWRRGAAFIGVMFGLMGASTMPVQASVSAQYVVFIGFDGLHADAIAALGPTGAPNLWRIRSEGAYTDNARTDYDRTVTAPNHLSIMTGRTVAGAGGHLWGRNDHNLLALAPSIHVAHSFSGSPVKPAYEYVSSVFDVVHDRGLRTALFHQKYQMALAEASYDDVNGAPDTIGVNNGRKKIDAVYQNQGAGLVREWVAQMSATPFQFSYLLFALTDWRGHTDSWDLRPGSVYMNSLVESDRWVGQIFNLIEYDPRFAGKTLVVVTADHGGQVGATSHHIVTDSGNFRVPVYVWGPGVTPGANLYALNPQYTEPGLGRPNNTDPRKPIRNGDVANLALAALGLPPIPQSTLNADQKLVAAAGGGTAPSPCGNPNINSATLAAIALWKECSTDGSWRMRATAGGLSAHYAGVVTSSLPFSSVRRVSIESNDVVNTSNPAAIAFDLRMSNAAVDGVNFAAPAAADLCMNVSVPAGATVLVGANRTPVAPPFNLTNLGACN